MDPKLATDDELRTLHRIAQAAQRGEPVSADDERASWDSYHRIAERAGASPWPSIP